jgi:hypothetical protein
MPPPEEEEEVPSSTPRGHVLTVSPQKPLAAESSRVLELETELTQVTRILNMAGECESLFTLELADHLIRYTRATTALASLPACPTPSSPTSISSSPSTTTAAPEIPVTDAQIKRLEQALNAIGDDHYLFDAKTAALIQQYIQIVTTREAARRQPKRPAETEFLNGTILRFEEELRTAGRVEGLVETKITSLIMKHARALAELGDANADHAARPQQEQSLSLFREALEAERAGSLAVAFDLFQHAATLLHPAAQCKLGWCYQYGKGTLKDRVEALTRYRRSASQDCPEAQFEYGYAKLYGLGIQLHRPTGVAWIRRAAMSGYVRAQEWIGRCYERGWEVERDDAEALHWYRQGAIQGDAKCQMLAARKLHDRGTPFDLAEAVHWFHKATEQGEVSAPPEPSGPGVPEERRRDLSAREERELGIQYRDGIGQPQDHAKAITWLRRAAEKGDGLAQYDLACGYQQGLGAGIDLAEAYAWLQLAIANDIEATAELAELRAIMSARELTAAARLHEAYQTHYAPGE